MISPLSLIPHIPPISQSGFIKLTKNTFISFMIVVTVLVGSGLIYLFSPWSTGTAEAAWFDDNWGYRQRIPIDTHTASETNVYNAISVDTATLTTDKLQADCDDLRFTKQNGEILPYQIVSGCDSATTVINVGFDTMPVAPFNIYMYYGNPSASAGSTTLAHAACGNGCAEGTFATEEKGPTPIAYWKFDDGQGTTAQDSTSNNLDGTLNNTLTWKTEDFCVAGKCLWFDGANNENVSKADDPALDFAAADNFTVQAWVKRNGASSAVNYILTKAQAGYTGYKLYQDASGDYCFDVSDGTNTDTACTSAVEFDDDKWHLVTGVKAATTSITLYVDGNQRAQDATIAATGTLANTGIFYAGVDLDGTTSEWLGYIDEVKVYRDNSARTAAQVQADYNSRSTSDGASQVLGQAVNNNPNALNNGLVGYWKMDEEQANQCSGGVNDSCDSSGNSNNGAWTNNAIDGQGIYGQGVAFDGTDDYVEAADSASLDVTNITISGWIKATALGGTILQKSTSAGTDGYSLDTSGSKIRFCAAGGCASSTTTLSTATWTHIAITFDGTTTKFYLNGVLDGTSTTITSVPTNALVLRMGVDSTSAADYNGTLDEVRLYNRAVTSAEVNQVYLFAPGPNFTMNLEEGTGQNTYDGSSFDHPGTLGSDTTSQSIDPAWIKGKFGNALDFDGTDDYVKVVTTTGNTDILHPTSGITLSAWIKVDGGAGTYRHVISLPCCGTWGNPYAHWALRVSSANVLEMVLHNTTNTTTESVAGSTTISANSQWVHVAATYDKATVKLYVNGVLDGSAAKTYALGATGSEAYAVGTRHTADPGEYFNGGIDQLKMYPYAQTTQQVVQDMNAGHPAPGSPVGSAVSYWKLDQGYGTNADDSMDAGNDLTLSSASWTNAGKFNKAWNGTNAVWLSRADDADFDFAATEDFTISLWFKSDSATNPAAVEYILNKGPTSAAGYSVYANTDGTICFGIDDDATWGPDVASCTTSDFYDGNWHFLTAVRDVTADTTRIYIDALSRDSDTDTTTATLANASSLFVGDLDGVDNGDEFAGDLDEIKIYRSALNEGQVKLDMNRGSGQVQGALSDKSGNQPNSANNEYCIPGDTSTCTAPVARWDMEEAVANSCTGGTNDTCDTSTNGYDGAWTGNATASTSGYNGKGTVYDGSGDYTNITSSFQIPSQNGTVSFWVKPIAGGSYDLMGSGVTSNDFRMSPVNNLFGFFVTSEYRVSYATDPTVGVWSHWTLTWDQTNGSILYVNGIRVASNATAPPAYSQTGLKIGSNPDGTENFNGHIDQVRVYNYARSTSQVAWDYNKGKPLGWWKMDECQGTVANDSSVNGAGTGSNGNTGTITIGATGTQASAGTCTTASTAWLNGVTGKRNYSLNFDGTDDYVDLGDPASLQPTNITVATWFKTSSSSAMKLVRKRLSGYAIQMGDTGGGDPAPGTGKLSFWIVASGPTYYAANSTVAYNDGNWHHAVGTFDGSNVKLYVDGNLITTTSAATSIAYSGGGVAIARDGDNAATYFSGQMDDVRLYNYALTLKQVQLMMNEGAVRYGPVTGAPQPILIPIIIIILYFSFSRPGLARI